jgi:hypothetical protein
VSQNRKSLKPVLGGVRDVALILYTLCTDSIKPSLQFSCNIVPRDHFVSRFLYYKTAGIKCLEAAIKSYPILLISVVIFSGPSVSLMPALLSFENLVPLKQVLGDVKDVSLVHYPSCTDSIKQSLLFSCNFFVINASEGFICFQYFVY